MAIVAYSNVLFDQFTAYLCHARINIHQSRAELVDITGEQLVNILQSTISHIKPVICKTCKMFAMASIYAALRL